MTDQIVPIDAQLGLRRQLATLTDANKQNAINNSVRMMVGLDQA